LVMACANFVSVRLGLQTALQILARKLLSTSQRVGNIIKDFKYYALADGLKEVLRCTMKPWREPARPHSPQLAILLPAAGGLP